ncbi:hypothetical protein [Staphylococcus pettenkoferi]|uniref:hypothetical protein n=1 Tax=Staphylococcus pettenkoferi TaxID=170573 RepID=UPI0002432B76|nr:hypothetical protein [Staphylococcus pettenkoferi]ASE37050.1 hypothetical protein CEP67_07050 [Staphylococcus pettenkoferi]EHM70872.1 hypothetical protein SEVCU012_1298 [Staphylococcus pettenkoferi VCU012]MCY1581772.1 hypothetical protein [Staphylococcus pettenkoferi]MCY1621039.1 hypothetical protein [Staphylococcus pettenkoferi]
MTQYLTKEEFQQHKKLNENSLNSVNDKLNQLPSVIEDKITIAMNDMELKMMAEFKSMRNSLISWSFILIAFAGLIARIFGLF